jgi:hypothetical protein
MQRRADAAVENRKSGGAGGGKQGEQGVCKLLVYPSAPAGPAPGPAHDTLKPLPEAAKHNCILPIHQAQWPQGTSEVQVARGRAAMQTARLPVMSRVPGSKALLPDIVPPALVTACRYSARWGTQPGHAGAGRYPQTEHPSDPLPTSQPLATVT